MTRLVRAAAALTGVLREPWFVVDGLDVDEHLSITFDANSGGTVQVSRYGIGLSREAPGGEARIEAVRQIALLLGLPAPTLITVSAAARHFSARGEWSEFGRWDVMTVLGPEDPDPADGPESGAP